MSEKERNYNFKLLITAIINVISLALSLFGTFSSELFLVPLFFIIWLVTIIIIT